VAEPAEPPVRRTELSRGQGALAALGGALLDALMRTTRIGTEGDQHFRQFWDAGKPTVFVLWHGRLLPPTYHHRQQGVVTLISQHRDGEYITRVVHRWGYIAVRGSSSRGGMQALRELLRHLRAGRSLAITPDGPRGPREKLKLGPLLAAQRAGAPVIPVGSAASRARFFGGWDRFLIPMPFARLQVVYGEPVWIPRDADEAALQAIAEDIEGRMAVLTRRAEALVA
jgi:lysophospholipid acyltransferase (LPLAT)-like uncharacterized protein